MEPTPCPPMACAERTVMLAVATLDGARPAAALAGVHLPWPRAQCCSPRTTAPPSPPCPRRRCAPRRLVVGLAHCHVGLTRFD